MLVVPIRAWRSGRSGEVSGRAFLSPGRAEARAGNDYPILVVPNGRAQSAKVRRSGHRARETHSYDVDRFGLSRIPARASTRGYARGLAGARDPEDRGRLSFLPAISTGR